MRLSQCGLRAEQRERRRRPVGDIYLSFKEEVARMTGLEPATSGVTGRRSNQLSYIRVTATSPRGASDMTDPESCQRPIARSCG